MPEDERTPLLQFPGESNEPSDNDLGNQHQQFCRLVGTRPLDAAHKNYRPHSESLYARATQHHASQSQIYTFAATMTHTLLLAQIVLGAALTGLGASRSSHVLITTFGAMNTIIAGVIAFVKSRGQPMRARMFRDDLERVVDEIENSAVMWLGISKHAHGYDDIDTDEQVTVRSEVARLTRLYDRAVKTNTLNDPDMYATGGPGDLHSATLRSRPGQLGQPVVAAAIPGPIPDSGVPAPAPVEAEPRPQDADASPASKPPPTDSKPKDADQVKDDGKPGSSQDSSATADKGKGTANAAPESQNGSTQKDTTTSKTSESKANATAAPLPSDPDQSPASAAAPPKKHNGDTE